MKSSILITMMLISVVSLNSAEKRDIVLNESIAYWDFGSNYSTSKYRLKEFGDISKNVDAYGKSAIIGSKCIRLTDGYLDAGKELNIKGDKITIYLRAYDPDNKWNMALFAKRGNKGIVNFNLFSIHGLIGFEFTTKNGMAGRSFPISLLGENSWHDIIGRYDGQALELFCDGKRMVKLPWKGGELRENDEPALIGAETDRTPSGEVKPVRPFTGFIQEAAIWQDALSDEEIAVVMQVKKITNGPGYKEPNMYLSKLHQHPDVGVFADPIPFYHDGVYHVYYLHPVPEGVNWNHISTKDFITWKEHPVALRPDGAKDSPDGLCMFTGSIIEKNGVFHCYYTGHNPNNPNGLEFIMHTTSKDLDHWTKHPEDIIQPDGKHYRIGKKSKTDAPWIPSDWNFRDPYVFYNEDENCYWMLFLGEDPQTGTLVQGLAVSNDLAKWEFREPLDAHAGQECPDMFKIGNTWYLVGGAQYLIASESKGPYKSIGDSIIDIPFIYAGKRMFDGKRHIWTGWLRGKDSDTDSGNMQWGGTQCLPRELYAGKNDELYCKPVDEIMSAFGNPVIDLRKGAIPNQSSAAWKSRDGAFIGSRENGGSQISFDTPANYMMECELKINRESITEITMRENGSEGYKLILNSEKQTASLRGTGIAIDRNIGAIANKNVKIKAFILGTMIEIFIDDRYALSCRAYDYPAGKLGFNIIKGKTEIIDLKISTEK